MENLENLIVTKAIEYGIPPELALAQAKVESNFNQNVVSSAGAIGIFQLMPSTARDLGVDPYNLEQNIEGGLRYLAEQYKRFKDWGLALAAYNAGPGNVMKYGGLPPFQETQKYVDKIMGSYSTSINSSDKNDNNFPWVTVGVAVIATWLILK